MKLKLTAHGSEILNAYETGKTKRIKKFKPEKNGIKVMPAKR